MMQCTSPITGYRAVEGGGIVQSVQKGYADQHLTVRCGQCIGCRLERSRIWAIRSVHEASLYDKNIFATLTYDDDNLPWRGNLQRPDITNFFKRLRKKTAKIRTFYCGEYGDETKRPHYHALIFNYCPDDKELMFVKDGHRYYRSEKLDKIWRKGHVNFSDEVTFSNASYTAGYVTKKATGKHAKDKYQWIDPDTGEVHEITPEFQGQSLKPGIGQPWIEKWLWDVYTKDEIVIDGTAMRPPRYYDQQCEKLAPELWADVQRRRKEKYIKHRKENENGPYYTSKEDPDEYYGSGRQMFAKNRITLSKQKDRKEE
ncbi:replication initiator protein [Microviridae sp.]|nr:replication initiator protein [Microviridae sp.]